MASVKFEKGSREWYMFQDYWRLCQKFWIMENNDKYWDDVVDESGDFIEKYKDIDLAKGLACAFVDILDSQNKEVIVCEKNAKTAYAGHV